MYCILRYVIEYDNKKGVKLIKFILAIIAMIFVGLAAYVYMNPKETDTSMTNVTQKTETSIVKKETPSVQQESVSAKAEVVSKKKSSAKNTTVKSPKVVSSETSNEMVDTEEIGKGLTLEGIENADVSDEEKDLMLTDMVYYQSKHMPEEPSLTEEEILQMIEQDAKNGILNK